MHYVIGDVHGCYDEMMGLVMKIEKKDEDARFIFVGDFIDRGPKVWETLEWAMKNITENGKYQSVLGNHEASVIEWYQEFIDWYNLRSEGKDLGLMPETDYDFSKLMDGMNMLTPKKMEPIIEFFSRLPYSKAIEIETAYGEKILYRIVHAAYNYYAEDEEQQKKCNIWDRNVWGYIGNDHNNEIVIHGHTPTIDHDYLLRGHGDDAPGMIGYRANAINVDGGCCYLDKWFDAPCMLCAICLETLEEIYSHTVEERLIQMLEENVVKDSDKADMWKAYYIEKAEEYSIKYRKKVPRSREQMLRKMGKI